MIVGFCLAQISSYSRPIDWEKKPDRKGQPMQVPQIPLHISAEHAVWKFDTMEKAHKVCLVADPKTVFYELSRHALQIHFMTHVKPVQFLIAHTCTVEPLRFTELSSCFTLTTPTFTLRSEKIVILFQNIETWTSENHKLYFGLTQPVARTTAILALMLTASNKITCKLQLVSLSLFPQVHVNIL